MNYSLKKLKKDLNNILDTGLISKNVYKILYKVVNKDENNINSLYYGSFSISSYIVD